MNEITFTTVGGLGAALHVSMAASGSGFVFQCIDEQGVVQVETFHATFADALRQVAQRMDTDAAYAGFRLDYNVTN